MVGKKSTEVVTAIFKNEEDVMEQRISTQTLCCTFVSCVDGRAGWGPAVSAPVSHRCLCSGGG